MGILSCILSAYLSITIGHQKLMHLFFKSSRPAPYTSALSDTLVLYVRNSNPATLQISVFWTIGKPCECHHTPQFHVLEKETKGTTPSCFEKKSDLSRENQADDTMFIEVFCCFFLLLACFGKWQGPNSNAK